MAKSSADLHLSVAVASLLLAGSLTARAQTSAMPSCSPTAPVTPPPPAETVPAVPAGPITFEVVAQYGGRLQAVAADASRAFVGVGTRVVVLDISDPATPREIGSSDPLPGTPLDIAISGPLAYVAAAEGGLVVLDIGDSQKPRMIGHADTPGFAEAIALAGARAYIADGPGGLRTLDVSEPSNPREVGSAFTHHIVLGVAIANGHAYLAAGGAGLLVANISTPGAAVELGRAKTAGFASGVAVDATHVWIADAWAGLTLMDVQQLWRPTLVMTHPTAGWAMDVELDGERLFMANARGGVEVIDVSVPTKPATRARASFGDGHAHRVSRTGTRLLVVDRNHGLHIIDVPSISSLVKLGTWEPLGFADGVAVSGDLAWVAADSFGVSAIDLAAGREVARLAIPEHFYAKNVTVAHPFIFVTPQFGASLGVIDATVLSNATLHWYQWPFGSARNQALAGGLLVIPNEWGLRVVNVSDPRAPCELSFINFTGGGPSSPGPSGSPTATGIALSGNYGFAAATAGGMWVIDLSDPRSPKKVAESKETLNGQTVWYEDLTRHGSYVYAYGHTYDAALLRVIDVSDPLHPMQRGSCAIPIGVQGWGPFLAATSTTVFVADRSAGLIAVDVRDPEHPAVAGRHALPAPASSVTLDGDRIYVAADDAGLIVLRAHAATASRPPTVTEGGGGWSPPPRPMASAPAQAPPHTAKNFSNVVVADNALCTVTSTSDAGSGTLRDCMTRAAAGTTITFDPTIFPPTHPASIQPLTPLPQLNSGGVTIDASDAGVILDGSAAPKGTNGITIHSSGNRIRGMQILHFDGDGISIRGASNTIGGDRSRGAGQSGEGNVISANKTFGVRVAGNLDEAQNNAILGNLIGLDVTGRVAMGNTLEGVNLLCDGNTVGGRFPADRNVISGSGETDVHVTGRGHNRIIGNYIGTDITGQARLSDPGYWSVSIEGGAFANLVASNVIVGGLHTGVAVTDAGTSYNEVVDNLIGLNATGSEVLGGGIIASDEAFNRIEGNVVTGTIDLYNRATGNVVTRNLVGTDAMASRAVNAGAVAINVAASHNFIGGSDGEGNIVSGRIRLSAGSTFNVVAGNAVGTDLSGTTPLIAPYFNGIDLTMADHNAVQDNVIGFIRYPGIRLSDASNDNWLRGNHIRGTKVGVDVADSERNAIAQNAFVQNDTNAIDKGSANAWDDGALGNYWSNYTGSDANGDGTGDVPHAVSPNGLDRHPLMSAALRNPAPSITSLEPATVPALSEGFTLIVRGANFVRGATVLWNGVPLPTIFSTAGELRAAIEASQIASQGRAVIAVVNPSPGGSVSAEATLIVIGQQRRRGVRH